MSLRFVQHNIKLIYFSTNYVYPGTKGNYSEKDALLPVNNYAWSNLVEKHQCSCTRTQF